jgi:hypothetical protein
VVMPSSMCEDEVLVLVFNPTSRNRGQHSTPTSDHQQNPLQPVILQASSPAVSDTFFDSSQA